MRSPGFAVFVNPGRLFDPEGRRLPAHTAAGVQVHPRQQAI